MDEGESMEIWLSFIQAKFLKDAKTHVGRCPACRSPKDCNNYFCVHCKVGGLCPVTFRAGGEHHRHCWLQVRRQSGQSAIDPKELAKFIGTESTKHIQPCILNGSTLCYLTRTKIPELNGSLTEHFDASRSSIGSLPKRAKSHPVSNLKTCQGCRHLIANSQKSKEEFMVCCLQCLTIVAQREPEKNLLRLRDGALDLQDVFPLTALEKINSSFKYGGRAPASTSRALDAIDAAGCSGANDGEPPEPALGSQRAAANSTLELVSGASNFALAGENRCSGRAKRRSVRCVQSVYESESPEGTRRDGQIVDEPRCSSVCTDVSRLRYMELHCGESICTSAGNSRGSGGAKPRAAMEIRDTDYSAFPIGYRCEGLLQLIAEAMVNDDWELYIGDRGKTS